MRKNTRIIVKILYSLIFLLIIPGGLWLWARYTRDIIDLPIPWSKTTGWIILISGIIIMLWGMISLIIHGKGLPMNAFPPPYLVKKGPYRIFQHPIYWGFGMLITGYFSVSQTASGLWLVTPVSILGMIALVWGYEALDLKKRFPNERMNSFFDLPFNNDEKPNLQKKVSSLIWLLGLLIISNILIVSTITTVPVVGTHNNFIIEFNYPYYMVICLLYIVITPFIFTQNKYLRSWIIMVICGLFFFTFLILLVPYLGKTGFITGILLAVTSKAKLTFNVPIFLVFISTLALFRQTKKYGILFTLGTSILVLLQLMQLEYPLYRLLLAILIFLFSSNYNQIWIFLKESSERIANSWREWEFGKVRVINHGFYVGFGAFLGIFLSGILAGKVYAWAILVFAIIVIVFSALWAQIIEGSEKLKRPYGYYGALVGIIFASLVVWLMGADVWIIIGVISVFMPWVQGIGRLRCLVNGCCHGSKTNDSNIGIRYFHDRSRVCGISGLKGEWLHPTPLYAIIWLFLIGFVLLALWENNFPAPFIFGMYLILTGIGRFVEEAYRGEVQTPIIKGLRLYQWTAIFSVLVGIIMTMIQVESIAINPDFGWQTLLAAFIGGLFTTFAMGVDFPHSNARFSRLV